MAVKDSCAPVLACQGHAWPEALDCDRFPAQEDMCLTSLTKPKSGYLLKGKTYLPPSLPPKYRSLYSMSTLSYAYAN